MEMITVTFEISKERLLEVLSNCGDLKQDISTEELQKAFSEDVECYVSNELSYFIEEGVNSDVYSDFFEEGEDED